MKAGMWIGALLMISSCGVYWVAMAYTDGCVLERNKCRGLLWAWWAAVIFIAGTALLAASE